MPGFSKSLEKEAKPRAAWQLEALPEVQVHVPTLGQTAYGTFAAVHLAAGGQVHVALIGRTFLRNFTMIYEGRTGTVTIYNE